MSDGLRKSQSTITTGEIVNGRVIKVSERGVNRADHARGQDWLHFDLDALEHVVDALEVLIVLPIPGWIPILRLGEAIESEDQIVVDVGVHARQREL